MAGGHPLIKSKSYGISVKTESSEDHLINFKSRQVVASAAATIDGETLNSDNKDIDRLVMIPQMSQKIADQDLVIY